MSDEWEEEVESMLADLVAADAVPESIKMMNEAAKRHVLSGALTHSIICDAIFRRDRNLGDDAPRPPIVSLP